MKTLRNKKTNNYTQKNRNRTFFQRKIIPHIISIKNAFLLKTIINDFFEKKIKKKIEKYPRPFPEKYNNFLERKRGRFEITPPPFLLKKIWNLLLENKSFVKQRNEIKTIILENANGYKEELGILPVEPHSTSGDWHRDIFITGKKDFVKPPFYITQLIYLDDKADTAFCLHSETNPNNNPKKYVKKNVSANTGTSIVFDGRTLHKGLENNTDETRYAIYIVYFTDSYVDKESRLTEILL